MRSLSGRAKSQGAEEDYDPSKRDPPARLEPEIPAELGAANDACSVERLPLFARACGCVVRCVLESRSLVEARGEGDRWPMHPLLWHQSRRHVVYRQRRSLRYATATQHECTDGSDVLLSSPGGTARAEAGSPSSKVTPTFNVGTSFLRKSFRGNANVLSNVSGSLFSKSLVFVAFFWWSLLALLCGTVFLWVLSTGANCRS